MGSVETGILLAGGLGAYESIDDNDGFRLLSVILDVMDLVSEVMTW